VAVTIKSDDIIPLDQVRARFTELAEEVRAGAEKIITRNGESYVALVDARRLDHYHRLEREHIHLALLQEALGGLQDLRDGRVATARQVLAKYKVRRKP
jgi:prevent-host-death family protein